MVGAGPIGLEAALQATHLGFDVRVYEAGRVGRHCLEWGHVRMFSPWSMNCSPLGLRVLAGEGRPPYRDPAECPSGRDYARRYLAPLAGSAALRGRVLEGRRVVAIGREGLTKSDRIGDPARASGIFRILVELGGSRTVETADRVIDASGTYGRHRHPGDGGIPVPGEERAGRLIDYHLPDVLGRDRRRFAGRRIIVIGSGYSAATAAVALRDLARASPGTRVVWSYRRDTLSPCERFPDDPLPLRDALAAEANALAAGSDPACLTPAPGTLLTAIRPVRPGPGPPRRSPGLRVTLRRGKSTRTLRVDRVVALTGYEPDRSIYAELQIHECYATGGPMKVAAALIAGGAASADCLSAPAADASSLANPEPGFFILGSKSYGRNSSFLIRNGIEQVRIALGQLPGPRPRARPRVRSRGAVGSAGASVTGHGGGAGP